MSTPNAKYVNRELSWLAFNQRVLNEARDAAVPLLERLKFLAITASNLDEFFMVRVGGLKILVDDGTLRKDPSGMTPKQQLKAVRKRVAEIVADQYECYLSDIEPALRAAGFQHLAPKEWSAQQAKLAEQVFSDELLSVLSPIAVENVHSFPHVINRTLNLCVRLAPEEGADADRFAVIPVGRSTHRFITLPAEDGYQYSLVEEVITAFVGRFFPGEEILECAPFRLTRNADMSVQEELASDLLAEMEEILAARKSSDCVRLELADSAGPEISEFLAQMLEVDDPAVYRLPEPLDFTAFMSLTDSPGFDSLKYPTWPSRPSPAFEDAASVFDVLSRGDVLLSHPYESFEPVVRLLEQAAVDPDVLAIKQTLYRTSRDSPIVKALMRAAGNGKYVTAIVELKARFDEARNMEWARAMEEAEVQVVYGVRGLKTHAKVCLIVRREPHGMQRYVHFGTGNYNEATARLYSDVSLMTCDDDLAADAAGFFSTVTGYSQPQTFRKIEIAPIGLREKILEMIQVEVERKRQGQNAFIRAKLNSIVDPELIDALYTASQAGVPVRLNVRGICCLRPGVKGLSENITVRSIIDRYLEHSRIIYFHHGGDERVFISSADWMPRNLDRRIELLVPVEDPKARKRLIHMLRVQFDDTEKCWEMQSDGSYVRRREQRKANAPRSRSQEILFNEATQAYREIVEAKPTMFEPHRAPGADE